MVESAEISGNNSETTKEAVQSRTYEVEGNRIQVQYKEFSPKKDRPQEDEAVIFLPGWSGSGSKTIEDLTQQFGFGYLPLQLLKVKDHEYNF